MRKIGVAIERLYGKQVVAPPVDTEPPGKGEQTKRMHAPNNFGPLGSVLVVISDGKGMVEMGNSGNVPGVTGHGARAETAYIVDKICDDHFDKLKGKPGGRRWACRSGV